MSRLSSRPLTSAAPLPRDWLDSAASPLRVFFGVVFLAWSWVSTVLILGKLLTPALSSALLPGIPDSYIAAIGVAILVSAGEFVSADRWPGAYWAVLLIADAPFTAWQTHAWLALIVQPLTELTTGVQIILWVVSIICGIVAAIFGELLLFGRRRR